VIRTYKFRLYPTNKQKAAINEQLGLCCWLYNTALEQRIRAYKTNGTYVSYHDQAGELAAIKEQFPQFTKVHSQVLQDTLKRLDKAFQNFFRRIKHGDKPGFPRFRSGKRFTSMTYPQSGFHVAGNRLELSKTGSIRMRLHRGIPEGKIKTCCITREGEHWYTCLTVEFAMTAKKVAVSNAIGIDMGIENFATLSNGSVINNPRHLRKSEERLALLQHKNKATGRLHRKVANQRKDFLHKTSHAIVQQYDLIAHEDLQINNMVRRCKPVQEEGVFLPNGQTRKSGLNKSIHDAAWGMFLQMLAYKAESAGKHCIAVDPRNTSQRCSNCGAIVKKKLSERWHDCNICGFSLHRDINAAQNILSGTGTGNKAMPYFLKPPS
jgi:IS605 OrfB family transposase